MGGQVTADNLQLVFRPQESHYYTWLYLGIRDVLAQFSIVVPSYNIFAKPFFFIFITEK